MPWVRVGDNAATYPKLLQIAAYPGADDRAVNEVFGWLYRCATQSAAWLTDYVIDSGTAHMLGAARTTELIGWCVRAGLLSPIEIDGLTSWVLLNDPAFIHIRTRKELEWEAQRRQDSANTHVTVPVRLRDGDQCRYCGIGVQWKGPETNRRAEYDHRQPGTPATIDTLVVACRSCNGARSDNPEWDLTHPLRPPPAAPYYGKATAAFLKANGHTVPVTLNPEALIERSTTTAANPGDAATGAHPGQARPGARPEGPHRTTTTDREAAAEGAHPIRPDPGAAATGANPATTNLTDTTGPEAAAEGAHQPHGPGDAATGAHPGHTTPPPPTGGTPACPPPTPPPPPRPPESLPESQESLPTVPYSSSAKSGLTGSGRDGTDRQPPPWVQFMAPPPQPPTRPPRRRGSRGRGQRRPSTPPPTPEEQP